MARLNIERQKELEPERIKFAIQALEKHGMIVDYSDNTKVKFNHNGSMVTLFPYSGWHSGATIKDGRGLKKLIDQL